MQTRWVLPSLLHDRQCDVIGLYADPLGRAAIAAWLKIRGSASPRNVPRELLREKKLLQCFKTKRSQARAG